MGIRGVGGSTLIQGVGASAYWQDLSLMLSGLKSELIPNYIFRLEIFHCNIFDPFY